MDRTNLIKKYYIIEKNLQNKNKSHNDLKFTYKSKKKKKNLLK